MKLKYKKLRADCRYFMGKQLFGQVSIDKKRHRINLNHSIMRFFRSVGYALQGLKSCFYSEKNLRIQLIIAAIAFSAGIIFGINRYEWVAILLCTALVLGFEIMNTAIEMLSDIVTSSVHPVIKMVKDIAAGAVFLVSILSFIIGCIIFFPKFEWCIEYLFK